MLRHEQQHFRRLHSLDLLAVEIARVGLWFLPTIWWLGHSLRQLHEYQADAAVATPDRRAYAQLLLRMALVQPRTLLPSLLQKPLKTRIQFLILKPSLPMKKLAYLLVLPLLGVAAWLFAQEQPQARTPEASQAIAFQPEGVATWSAVSPNGQWGEAWLNPDGLTPRRVEESVHFKPGKVTVLASSPEKNQLKITLLGAGGTRSAATFNLEQLLKKSNWIYLSFREDTLSVVSRPKPRGAGRAARH